MKSFYSCIDSSLKVPQPVQHLVIREKATKAGGAIVFYGAEEVRTLAAQSFIKPKLMRTPGLNGVIFFTFHQFRYGKTLNFPLLNEILQLGMEVHFAREDLSVKDEAALQVIYPFLMTIDFTLRRDASAEWKQALEILSAR